MESGVMEKEAEAWIRTRLNSNLSEVLPYLVLVGAVLYGGIAAWQFFGPYYSLPNMNWLTLTNSFTAVLFFSLFLIFKTRLPPVHLAHPWLAGVLLLVLFNTLIRVYWFPQIELGIIFFMVVSAFLVNSIFWFSVIHGVAILSSILVFFMVFSDNDLLNDAFATTGIGAINSILIFIARYSSLVKSEKTSYQLNVKTEELENLNHRLSDSVLEKSRFLSSMSHELRTPLNAIIGFSELIKMDKQQTNSNPKEIEYLDIISKSGKHLLSLIADLLEIGAVDSRSLKLDRKNISLAELINECHTMVMPYLSSKKVELQKNISDQIMINADRTRIRQVLINLINNAIKFSAFDASIVITAKPVDKEIIEVSLQDHGPGIPPADREKIFSEFYRSDRDIMGDEKSTGIGLAVCKRMVEYHGGEIWVDPEYTNGARIVFTISAGIDVDEKSRSPQITTPRKSIMSALSLDILVAEDNETNRLLIREILLKGKHNITEAVNGKAAYESALATPPDVVIMDIQMPVMGGLEATKLLKSNTATRHIPVIALTAHADKRTLGECYQAGCTEVLSKPIDLKKLNHVLENVFIEKSKKLA